MKALILLLVIALPAGGFYYYQQDQAAKKRAKLKAQMQASGSSSNLFDQRAPAADAAGAAAGAAAPGAAAPSAPAQAEAPAGQPQMANASASPMPGQPTQDAPSSMPGAGAPVAADPAAMGGAPMPVDGSAPADPAATAAASSSPTALFSPKGQRDPMQSVSERQLIELLKSREKLAGEMAKRARADMANRQKAAKPKPPKIETLITLQGIFEVQGRLTAMVNNDIVSRGQTIKGAKVVNITPTSVTFEYMEGKKKNRFTRTVKTK